MDFRQEIVGMTHFFAVLVKIMLIEPDVSEPLQY